MPDMKREGDIHIGGDMKVAWSRPGWEHLEHRQRIALANLPARSNSRIHAGRLLAVGLIVTTRERRARRSSRATT